jgi:hypothetical protein
VDFRSANRELRNSSARFATLAAIRRASSLVSDSRAVVKSGSSRCSDQTPQSVRLHVGRSLGIPRACRIRVAALRECSSFCERTNNAANRLPQAPGLECGERTMKKLLFAASTSIRVRHTATAPAITTMPALTRRSLTLLRLLVSMASTALILQPTTGSITGLARRDVAGTRSLSDRSNCISARSAATSSSKCPKTSS